MMVGSFFVTIFPNSGVYTGKKTQSLKNKNHYGSRTL